MGSTNRVTTIRRRWLRLGVVQSLVFILLLTQGCSPKPLFDLGCATHHVTITVLYSTEKNDWLQHATNEYNQMNMNKCIYVDLIAQTGSLDSVQDILQGVLPNGVPGRPTIWSPASFLEIQLLSDQWAATPPVIDYTDDSMKPRSLVHSPLVFAVWQSRSKVLSNTSLSALKWKDLHDLLLHGMWSDPELGGDSSWGHPKFGQTQPDLSNSGLLTLFLIAYAFFNKQGNLTTNDIANPEFSTFLKEIEDQVWCFGASSGQYMDSFIQAGPAQHDIITTYESLVLEKESEATSLHEPLVMYYPPDLNIISSHPFVILRGPWVDDKTQLPVAQDYLNFLAKPEQQLSALTFGLRPMNTGNILITTNTPGNLFLQSPPPLYPPSSHLKSEEELTPLAQIPKTAVIYAIVNLWKNLENGAPKC